MKKLLLILSVTLLAGIVLYGIYDLFFKRTPEKLLKLQFNICLKDFDYTIETFEERWYPNGDGHLLIIFKFNKLTQNNIDYLKGLNPELLPIPETDSWQKHPSKIPKQYLNASAGYYVYESLNTHDPRNYKVFVIDTEKRIAVLYYQIM
jgi:hypothetical protein